MRIQRIYRGWAIVGRHRFLKLKWRGPDVTAIRSGVWQQLLVERVAGLLPFAGEEPAPNSSQTPKA